MVHRPMRVGTVGSGIAFEEDSPGVLWNRDSRKNTQAMRDPPELIKCLDGWHCQRLICEHLTVPARADHPMMAWMCPGRYRRCLSRMW